MKSENPQPCGLPVLEAELAETLQAIKDSFEDARTLDRRVDEFGHRRSSVVNDAVKLLTVSAEIGLAIAKIKGEFNQNISVLRGDIPRPPRRVPTGPVPWTHGEGGSPKS
jgi:hypothetical protein